MYLNPHTPYPPIGCWGLMETMTNYSGSYCPCYYLNVPEVMSPIIDYLVQTANWYILIILGNNDGEIKLTWETPWRDVLYYVPFSEHSYKK